MDAPELDDDEVIAIYKWVDSYKLSRNKVNIRRDFADGSLMAEILKQNFPRHVDLHSFAGCNSVEDRILNWKNMNKKIFSKMGFNITKNDIDAIVNCKPKAIERVLKVVQVRIQNCDKSAFGTVSMQSSLYQQPKIQTKESILIKEQEEAMKILQKKVDKYNELNEIKKKLANVQKDEQRQAKLQLKRNQQ